MASNPMQRQARNSFLLGVLITLLIAVAVGTILVLQIKKLNEQIKKDEADIKTVFVANQNIKSGQTITPDMFTMQTVKSAVIPEDATSSITTLINTYSLCDKSGNNIYTDAEGKLYMQNNGVKTTVYQDTATGEYYIQETGGNKNYIETTQKALIAKVDMKANTVITSSLISRADEIETDDVRKQEYNVIILPIDLNTGDYIDVRLMLPNGEDFIVLSKKMATIPIVGGMLSEDTVILNLSEDEILTMSSAIVEAFQIEGAKLYATKYVEAGIQGAAISTYVANSSVSALMDQDPNITNKAKAALVARYTEGLKNIRNNQINKAIDEYGDENGASSGIEESITVTKETRQKYLQSLYGTAPVK